MKLSSALLGILSFLIFVSVGIVFAGDLSLNRGPEKCVVYYARGTDMKIAVASVSRGAIIIPGNEDTVIIQGGKIRPLIPSNMRVEDVTEDTFEPSLYVYKTNQHAILKNLYASGPQPEKQEKITERKTREVGQ